MSYVRIAFETVPVAEGVEPADAQRGVVKANAPTMARATVALTAKDFIDQM